MLSAAPEEALSGTNLPFCLGAFPKIANMVEASVSILKAAHFEDIMVCSSSLIPVSGVYFNR